MRFIFLALLFYFSSFRVFPQTFNFNDNIKGKNFPAQIIKDVKQDSLGRIWISSSRGVFFSDGIENYPLPDSLYHSYNDEKAIHVSRSGAIWVYSARGRFSLFKGGYGRWERVRSPGISEDISFDYIQVSIKEVNGEEWLFVDTPEALYIGQEDQGFKEIPKGDLSGSRLSSIGRDSVEWIMYFEGESPARLHEGAFVEQGFSGIRLPGPPLVVKRSPATGEYFFLGSGYLARGQKVNKPTEILDRWEWNRMIYSSSYYGLGFSNEAVLYHFNSNLRKLLPAAQSKAKEIAFEEIYRVPYIHNFLMDREGILWLATQKGLLALNNLAFLNYSKINSEFLSEEITALLPLSDSRYLVGFNSGFQQVELNPNQDNYGYQVLHSHPLSRIFNFSKESRERVWFSASFDGVGLYQPLRDQVSLFPSPSGEYILSVNVDGDSVFIVSSMKAYKAALSARGDELFKNPLPFAIAELVNDRNAFLRKVGKLEDGTLLVLYSSQIPATSDYIESEGSLFLKGYDFLELGKTILIGTSRGLMYFQRDTKQSYFQEGTQNLSVYSLLLGKDSTIWMGTDNGLVSLKNEQLQQFNRRFGLAANETNRGALIETTDGNIWVGTTDGFSLFLKDELEDRPAIPKLQIRSVNLGNNQLLNTSGTEVSYFENSLRIEYAPIGFSWDKEIWVHYRLLGLESEWKLIQDPRSTEIFYPNLPPGTYEFQVKASYEAGEPTPIFSTGEFVILKPFYLQIWFLTLISLLLIGIGILIQSFIGKLKRLGVLETTVSQKEKEKALAEEQFKNVWDSSKNALLLAWEGKEIVAANPVFSDWCGLDKQDSLKGKEVSAAIQDDDFMSIFEKSLLSLPKEGVTFFCMLNREETYKEVEVSIKSISLSSEGKRLILTVFRDVTSEKEIENNLREAKEKAEEANRFKSSLLSNVSHEIRTPLNVILGGTEYVMMTRPEDHELLDELKIIHQSGEQLLATINLILNMAKVESKKLISTKKMTDVNEFVQEAIKPLQSLAKKKGIEMITHYTSPGLKGMIDHGFTEIIINNLVSNAIKYSESGSIFIEVAQVKDGMRLMVKDEGIGISEEFLPRIFDPFEQESTGDQRQFDGTGLGLTITNNLVKALSGTIHIQSFKGKGTEVCVVIPLT